MHGLTNVNYSFVNCLLGRLWMKNR